MKKTLLLIVLSVSMSCLSAQLPLPCLESYKINNGGGNCPLLEGQPATGKISLTFDVAVDPNNLPEIL